MNIKDIYRNMTKEQQRQFKAQLIKERNNRKKVQELSNINNAHEWITKNGYVNENGIPMEFEDRSFLVEPLQDESRVMAVMKCSQIGFSTISIFKSIFHNVKYGHNIIYTLPTDSDLREFAQAKTDLIIDKNTPLKANMTNDTLHLKSFKTLDGKNTGFWFMKGTHGKSASIMQTADILIKDEFDRSNQAVLNAFKSRIKASEYKREWEFSNPSFASFGVDATWNQSDQKYYFFWCPKCNHASYITYKPETFDRGQTHHVCKEREAFVCGACNEVLDRRKAKKQWVRKWKDRKYVSGYWISQMCAPWITAEELIFDEKTMLPDVFANFDLGLPYASGSNTLDPSHILANIQYDEYNFAAKNPGKHNVIGVDVGGTVDKPKFYIIKGTEEGLDEITLLHGEEKLHNYMKSNNIAQCVIDNAPYPEIAIRLQKAFMGKVARCVFDYKDERKSVYDHRYKEGIINVHRTRIFDYVVDQYLTRNRKVFILENEATLVSQQEESLTKHWRTQRKVGGNGERPEDKERIKELQLDRQGNVRPIWVNDGADHYSLADIYMAVAQMLVERKATIV